MRYIDVKGLTFYYDDEPVLEDISYFVEDGEFVILTGENGAAKSTLIKSNIRVVETIKGRSNTGYQNREGQKLSVGYIPQQIASFNVGFPSTVLELVQSGRYPKDRWFKKLTKRDHEHVRRALDAVGMWEMRKNGLANCPEGKTANQFSTYLCD